jgi:glycerol-3-phosphate dehydrogenase
MVDDVLGEAEKPGDLGAELGGGLTEREVIYLRDNEWAREPEDVLWRRTKCGLHIPAEARGAAADRIARLL